MVQSGFEATEACYSNGLTINTSACGDVVGECGAGFCQTVGNGYTDCCTPPDGVVDFSDIPAVVDKFLNAPGAPQKSRADIMPPTLDRIVDFQDIPEVVAGFRQVPGACPPPPNPDPCP